MSTQSIPGSPTTSEVAGEPARCATCGAPLAPDQRYCLECGERQVPRSEFLFGGTGQSGMQAAAHLPPACASGPTGLRHRGRRQFEERDTHRAGRDRAAAARDGRRRADRTLGFLQAGRAAPQVITVGGAAATGTGTEASFTSDWPAGTTGYTVQLETLQQSGTSVSAVDAAKAKATAKGATGVGALKSEEFASLTAGEYVIYSGDFPKKAEAEKAKAALDEVVPGRDRHRCLDPRLLDRSR